MFSFTNINNIEINYNDGGGCSINDVVVISLVG